MSGKTGTLYWLPTLLGDTSLDATETLLLIGLADHVNDEDECHVGIRRLAEYARVSYATARRRLAGLEDRGVIVRSRLYRDDGAESVYAYRLVRVDPPAQSERGPAHPDARGPRSPRRAGGPAHPDARAEPPTIEPPQEPEPLAADAAGEGVLFGEAPPAKPPNPAVEIARRVWEAKDPKPATPFVAAVKIAEALIGAGHEADRIVWAMCEAPTISTRSVELVLNRNRPPNLTPPTRSARDDWSEYMPKEAR